MMRTILITYGCLSCLFSAGYGEENQPTVSDIPSCGILEAGKQTEIAALEQAAEQGDVQAQCRLVVIYARGEKIPKDERKAFAWASRAAQSGNPEGMLLLANCYYQGTGISQDIVQTRKWLLKSAEKGHPEAQFNLGILSEQGEGMAKNLQQASSKQPGVMLSAWQGSEKRCTSRGHVDIQGGPAGIPRLSGNLAQHTRRG